MNIYYMTICITPMIERKYIEMENEDVEIKSNVHDAYLYVLFNEVMTHSFALGHEDTKAGNTIRMLNGKHKFVTKKS